MEITRWAERSFHSNPYLVADDNNPYSLPIILHVNPELELTHESVLEATVATFAHFFNDEAVAEEDEWMSPIQVWLEGRIRKVARRAKTSQWAKIRLEYLHYYHQHNGVEMLVLPPHPIDSPLPLVKKLQVSGLDCPRKELNVFEKEHVLQPILRVSTNPEVVMSTGKSIAQVAHATQLTIFSEDKTILEDWVENNYATQFVPWNALTESNNITEVHDAGLTEVEAGTLTVKASLA